MREQKKRSGFQVMGRLIGLVKPLSGYMVLAILMGLAGHLCASFITILGAYGVLHVLGIKTVLPLGWIFALAVLFALVRAGLRYGEQSCNHFIAFKLLALIRDKVFIALRRLCPAKLEGRDKGDLISVITSDIELLEVFYAHTISPAAIAFLFTIVMCLFIGSFHPLAGVLALIAYLTVGIVIPLLISRASGDLGMRFRKGAGDLSAFVLDSLRGLSETQQYGQGAVRLQQMNEKTEKLSHDEAQMKRIAGRNTAITNSVILIFDLAMLFLCTMLYQKGSVDFSGVLIPTVALMSSFGPCVALAALGSTLQNTFAAGNRVLDILDEEPLVEEITGKEPVKMTDEAVTRRESGKMTGDVEKCVAFCAKDSDSITATTSTIYPAAKADHVTFRYDTETILSDVSAVIPKNQIVGIVGKSGSGKSTLLKLFMRFWVPNEGTLSIADRSLEQINTADLRQMESFVTQETYLFHDSIKNNLRIAKLDATDQEIEEACKKASVHDFIMTLPNGYDTLVGELGDTLSGGERQRIGLARAFLHDAPLMLLDEPTSNLDSLNEAVILKSLHEQKKDKTIVLVSHRQSTMKIADTVYAMEDLTQNKSRES